jgi:hypothetical protein
MFNPSKDLLSALAIATLLMMSAAVSYAQTTGSVTMTATVSNFVELDFRRSSHAYRQFRRQHYHGRYRK